MIAVSLLGFGVFYGTLAAVGQRLTLAEAEERFADHRDYLDRRMQIVRETALSLQRSGTGSLQLLKISAGLHKDPSFVAMEWLPRIKPADRGSFEESIRAEYGDPGLSIRPKTDGVPRSKPGLGDEDVIYPIWFTTSSDRQQVGEYRRDSTLISRAAERPDDLLLGRHVAVKAVVRDAETVGVVLVRYHNLFAPHMLRETDYQRTRMRSRVLRTQMRITRGSANEQSLAVHTPDSDVELKPILTKSFRRGDQETYQIQFAERPELATKRFVASLLGLLPGPLFVLLLARFRWYKESVSLQSHNYKLVEEVNEQKQIQQTLKAMLDVRDQERRLLAAELHDGFVQEVMSAQMFIEAIHARLDETADETTRSHLDNVRQLLEVAIMESRQLIGDLQPDRVGRLGLVAALHRLATIQRERYDIHVTLRYPPEMPALDRHRQNALYRIAQEALVNIRKHSGTREATIAIRCDDESIGLEVSDHGVGFDIESIGEDSFGLEGIRERVSLHGGKMEIKSVPGDGTVLSARLLLADRRPTNGYFVDPTAAKLAPP